MSKIRQTLSAVINGKTVLAFVLGCGLTRLLGKQGHTALPTWATTAFDVLAVVLVIWMLILMIGLSVLHRKMRRERGRA